MAQNNRSGSRATTKLLLVVLVVIAVFAGWLYYDNRNITIVPVEFQTETGAPPLPPEFSLPGGVPPTDQ